MWEQLLLADLGDEVDAPRLQQIHHGGNDLGIGRSRVTESRDEVEQRDRGWRLGKGREVKWRVQRSSDESSSVTGRITALRVPGGWLVKFACENGWFAGAVPQPQVS